MTKINALVQAYIRKYSMRKAQVMRTAWYKQEPYTLVSKWNDTPEIGLQLGYYWVNSEGSVVSKTYWSETAAVFDFGNFVQPPITSEEILSAYSTEGTRTGRFDTSKPNLSNPVSTS